MIDSHSHIYCEAFDNDRDQVVERARAAGVNHVVLPNENVDSLERLRAMHARYPGFASMTVGLHPEEVCDDFHNQLAALRRALDSDPVVAVGEIGVDLYWDATWRDQQLEALDEQLHWCQEKQLPFIMHCRNALDEILWVLDNFTGTLPQGVFHSFTGTPQEVEQVRRRGDFYFGVNGIVTFKKSTVAAILPVVGLRRLLLETDAPYLAPVPHRGKRNESAFVTHTRDFVAAALGLAPAAVERACDTNAVHLFGLPTHLLDNHKNITQ